ncbi:MAG: uncharacterized protein H6Q90_1096 [Deltaproteobacteria bacterium]|nr:uncharacterized protein [Deltaproteobacteria bacterium]
MARIYIARSIGIGSFERHVVLKLIMPERASEANAVQMFLDEARLAACLNHQNVAQVFEVGEDAGIHYLAMEYVHGQDLRALLAKAGSQGTRVPLELALTAVAGAAAGLNHAHERRDSNGVPLGIVHRDVSPSNIMIGLDGSVKLLDFGIAKATQRSVETQSGIIKGKFAYMSPEQCRGREVDRRSDVFSLGIILYEITTQHRCFRAESDFDTMHRIVTGDVVRPTRLVHGYPQSLEAIVMKALAIDANQRYQSAGALLEAIESFSVAARMSLSTMSLGRFMREMFGEAPEPWLMNQAQRANQPAIAQPKEGTISNTNGHSSVSVRPGTDSIVPQDSVLDARTVLDLPRDHELGEPASSPEWDPKSYSTLRPILAGSTQTVPLTIDDLPERLMATPAGPTVAVASPPATSPSPPPTPTISLRAAMSSAPPPPPDLRIAPAPAPGFLALPLPAPPLPVAPPMAEFDLAPGTGGGAVSHAGYEPSAEAESEDLEIRSSRRPVFIGLGILALGVIAVIAVSLGGRHADPPAPNDEHRSLASDVTPDSARLDESPPPDGADVVTPPAVAPREVSPPQATPHEVPPQVIDAGAGAVLDPSGGEQSITIHVISEPPGADVLLGGKPIGTTPLDTKIHRGTGSANLVVHRTGYEDIPTTVDLSGDVSKEVRLVKLPAVDKKPAVDSRPPPGGNSDKKPAAEKRSPAAEKKPACQPPNQVDPFDSRPVCK